MPKVTGLDSAYTRVAPEVTGVRAVLGSSPEIGVYRLTCVITAVMVRPTVQTVCLSR